MMDRIRMPLLRPSPDDARYLFLPLLLLSIGVAGCYEGSAGDPVGLSWAEAGGVLDDVPPLPSLPELVMEAAGEEDVRVFDGSARIEGTSSGVSSDRIAESSILERGGEWIARWDASWITGPAEGREARYGLYDEAMVPLADRLGTEAAAEALERVAAAAAELRAWEGTEPPPEYRSRLAEVEEMIAWGREVLDRGDVAEAMRSALEAADRIRTVSPRSVARLLVSRARTLREEPPSGFTPTDRQRVDRLLEGAETALDREEYGRAIRRAYYASLLLGEPAR